MKGAVVFRAKKGSDIARSLGLSYVGLEVAVRDVCSARNLKPNALTFAKEESILENIIKSNTRPIVLITTEESINKAHASHVAGISYIQAERPRLSFIRALNLLLETKDLKLEKSFIHHTAVVEKDVEILGPVYISAHVYIGPRTKLGRNVIMQPNVNIYGDTTIGNNVTIHSGTVIGKPGFGFERDEDCRWVRFPHIGKVVIEDDVEIGGNVVIDKGALEDTVIGSGTKIDNLVHIAHSVRIGRNCVIVACAQMGGSDILEDSTWIGPNSSLIQNIRIGRNCLAGVGSVIVRDLPDGTTVAGNPATPIDDYKKMRTALRKLALGK